MPRQLVLICGKPSTGKTVSLRTLRNHESVFYLCTEANKPLSFPCKFKKPASGLEHPEQLFAYLDAVEKDDSIKTVVIDSLDFLMDMYESQVVLKSADTRKAWGDYAQFFKRLMQEYVTRSKKNWIFIAHLKEEFVSETEKEFSVPIKGSLASQGVESYFSTIVYTEVLSLNELQKLNNDPELLHITEEDEAMGIKHCYRLRITPTRKGSKIRSPVGLWKINQVVMDNDAQLLIDSLENYSQED